MRVRRPGEPGPRRHGRARPGRLAALALLACALAAGAGAGAAAAARHGDHPRVRPGKLWRAFPLGQSLPSAASSSGGAPATSAGATPPTSGGGPPATTEAPAPATRAQPTAKAGGSSPGVTTIAATAGGAALLALLVAATLRLRGRRRDDDVAAPEDLAETGDAASAGRQATDEDVGAADAPAAAIAPEVERSDPASRQREEQPIGPAPAPDEAPDPAELPRRLRPAPAPDDVVRAPPAAPDRGSDRGAPARRARRPAGARDAGAGHVPRSPFELISPKEDLVKYYTITISTYSSNGDGAEACEFAEMQEVLDAIRGDAVTSWDVVVDPKSGRAQPLVGVKESPYYVQISKQGRRRCIAKLSANYSTAHAIADTFFNQWEADAVSIVRQDQLEDGERARCERELTEGPIELEHWAVDGDGAPAIVSAAAVPQHAR